MFRRTAEKLWLVVSFLRFVRPVPMSYDDDSDGESISVSLESSDLTIDWSCESC